MPVDGGDNRHALVPMIVAAVVAIVGTVAILVLEIRRKDDIQIDGISMITSAAVEKAGAVAIPTVPAAKAGSQNTSAKQLSDRLLDAHDGR